MQTALKLSGLPEVAALALRIIYMADNILLEKVKELTQLIAKGNLSPEEEAELREEIKSLQLSIVITDIWSPVLDD